MLRLMITATEWLSSVRNVGGVRRRGLGRGQYPLPNKKEILLYIYCTALAMLTPTPPVPWPSRKVIFLLHVFSGVHLFAYRFCHLSDGFRPYNIVGGTLTLGLWYRQHHLTVL